MALELHDRLTVLGDLVLGDVHAAHDLQAGDHGALQLRGDGEQALQQTVDPHPHHHFALLRLQMDIAGPLVERPLDEAVDKADGRGGICGLPGHLRRDDVRRGGTGLPLHLLDDAGGALVAVQAGDGLLGGLTGGDHGDHLFPGRRLDLLLGYKVQRVAHGQIQGVLHQLHRHHAEFPCDIARHIPGQLHRDGDRRQIHELDAQLDLQRIDKVPLCNEAVLHQHVAQTLVGLLLDGQGFIQLFLHDDAGGDQQIAQPHICHIYHSKIRAAPFFRGNRRLVGGAAGLSPGSGRFSQKSTLFTYSTYYTETLEKSRKIPFFRVNYRLNRCLVFRPVSFC